MVRVQPGESRKALETALFCFLTGDSAHVLHAFLHAFAPNLRTRRQDAERFIKEVRDDDPELASYLRIEERELEGRGLTS